MLLHVTHTVSKLTGKVLVLGCVLRGYSDGSQGWA